jgi:hypothetical protein
LRERRKFVAAVRIRWGAGYTVEVGTDPDRGGLDHDLAASGGAEVAESNGSRVARLDGFDHA